MLKEEFCTLLFNQQQISVAPAFKLASKNFIDQFGKNLLVRFCEERDSKLIGCVENIVQALDADVRLRESLSSEFKLLYLAVKCKQGNFEYFNTILDSKVSTRFFKGIFSYLWPDTILSKLYLANFIQESIT